MAFSKYSLNLQPEALAVLQQAFDDACAKLQERPFEGMDEQLARDMIAKRIIEAAIERGERNPASLRRYALDAFELK